MQVVNGFGPVWFLMLLFHSIMTGRALKAIYSEGRLPTKGINPHHLSILTLKLKQLTRINVVEISHHSVQLLCECMTLNPLL